MLREDGFRNIKVEIEKGRLTPGNIRVYLSIFMVLSGIAIGIAYAVVAVEDSWIGWNNLSTFWQFIFKLQVFLFIYQFILIVFIKGKSNLSQILLIISYVFFTYKMAIDPIIAFAMFMKDNGEYHIYGPIILVVLAFGFLMHLSLVVISALGRKREKRNGCSYLSLLIVLFLISAITGVVFKNQLLGDFENFFLFAIVTFLFIALLIAAVEFVLAAYCVLRFPSFRMNPHNGKREG